MVFPCYRGATIDYCLFRTGSVHSVVNNFDYVFVKGFTSRTNLMLQCKCGLFLHCVWPLRAISNVLDMEGFYDNHRFNYPYIAYISCIQCQGLINKVNARTSNNTLPCLLLVIEGVTVSGRVLFTAAMLFLIMHI